MLNAGCYQVGVFFLYVGVFHGFLDMPHEIKSQARDNFLQNHRCLAIKMKE